jgi:hypothetical protein
MTRTVAGVILAVGLVAIGWSAGRAQTTVADFEMTITTPVGRTTIQCSRGCDFTEGVSTPPSLPSPNPTFAIQCSGREVQQCVTTINGHGVIYR